VALGQVSSPNTSVSTAQSSFHQFLHNHHHLSSGGVKIGLLWPQYQKSHHTNNKKKKKKKGPCGHCDRLQIDRLKSLYPHTKANISLDIQIRPIVMWYFVMDKSGAGAGFLRELRFSLPIYIPFASPQSSSLSPGAGTIDQEWPQCQ
jgi:hypothetical protein